MDARTGGPEPEEGFSSGPESAPPGFFREIVRWISEAKSENGDDPRKEQG